MGLVTSLRIAHDNCASEVFWPIPHQDKLDQECRALAVGRDRNGGVPGRDRNGRGGRHRRGGGVGGGNGSSCRRLSEGGSPGGGSNRDGGSHRRTEGGGGRSGGGRHDRRSGATGKGSSGKGGYGHSSSSGHGGYREHAHSDGYRLGSSNSSEDRGQNPNVTVMSGKRQVVPSLVDVASRLSVLVT